VVPHGLGVKRGDESAVGAGRRRMYKAAAISSTPLHPRIFFRFITSHNNPVRESL
jgi:hypothetical protein